MNVEPAIGQDLSPGASVKITKKSLAVAELRASW